MIPARSPGSGSSVAGWLRRRLAPARQPLADEPCRLAHERQRVAQDRQRWRDARVQEAQSRAQLAGIEHRERPLAGAPARLEAELQRRLTA